jgi:hypothetical protein
MVHRSRISGGYPRACADTSPMVTTVMAVVTTVMAVVPAVVTTVMTTSRASPGVGPLGISQHQRDHRRSRERELAARGEKAAPGFHKLVGRRRI